MACDSISHSYWECSSVPCLPHTNNFTALWTGSHSTGFLFQEQFRHAGGRSQASRRSSGSGHVSGRHHLSGHHAQTHPTSRGARLSLHSSGGGPVATPLHAQGRLLGRPAPPAKAAGLADPCTHLAPHPVPLAPHSDSQLYASDKALPPLSSHTGRRGGPDASGTRRECTTAWEKASRRANTLVTFCSGSMRAAINFSTEKKKEQGACSGGRRPSPRACGAVLGVWLETQWTRKEQRHGKT